MTREQAAEHALKSIEFEREAVKHCDSLDNPEYVRLMHLSGQEKWKAQNFIDAAQPQQ
jgi:hypothetical protein